MESLNRSENDSQKSEDKCHLIVNKNENIPRHRSAFNTQSNICDS